ncbi:MAG: HD domain-containing protein [Clostridiales bacterium]|nr:HD domain-containing protein [Clostridiales bacterium]
MEPTILLEMLHTAARLKDTTRHCDTPGGRRETVAEHSWRLALMAWWMKGEFPEVDMDKVIRMCLIHDLGECFTGDIPVFLKTQADEGREEQLLNAWVASLPEPVKGEMEALYREMEERVTVEARLYKALDGLEALISHNESDIASWEPNEYDLQLTYAFDRVQFSPWLTALREQIKQDSLDKIQGHTEKAAER